MFGDQFALAKITDSPVILDKNNKIGNGQDEKRARFFNLGFGGGGDVNLGLGLGLEISKYGNGGFYHQPYHQPYHHGHQQFYGTFLYDLHKICFCTYLPFYRWWWWISAWILSKL